MEIYIRATEHICNVDFSVLVRTGKNEEIYEKLSFYVKRLKLLHVLLCNISS